MNERGTIFVDGKPSDERALYADLLLHRAAPRQAARRARRRRESAVLRRHPHPGRGEGRGPRRRRLRDVVKRNGRNFLAYGFALSVAAHLIVLPFVHAQATVAQEEPPGTYTSTTLPTPPPTPPPTPTPRPTVPPTPPPREHPPTPAPHPQQLRIHPPQTTAHSGGSAEPREHAHRRATVNGTSTQPGTTAPGAGDVPATPAPPAATPTPTPKPTPTPLSCARPNVAATTLRTVAPGYAADGAAARHLRRRASRRVAGRAEPRGRHAHPDLTERGAQPSRARRGARLAVPHRGERTANRSPRTTSSAWTSRRSKRLASPACVSRPG